MAAEERDLIPAFLDLLGADNLCWNTDFPHPDHDWRGMRNQFLDRPEISIDAKRKIMCGNAARAYGLKAR
jgi:predicted TIM-barrel fold metal-dependent hydrolase